MTFEPIEHEPDDYGPDVDPATQPLPHHRVELRRLVAQLRTERDDAYRAAGDFRTERDQARAELEQLRAGLRQHWGAQAEHSKSAFPARSQEQAQQMAATYSRIREPGCLPTPYHVVTRYESDWQRVDAEQQHEDGDRG